MQPPSRTARARPLLLGAHVSIAGGLHRALERASALRCTAVQIFTHGRAQWRMRPVPDEAAGRFRGADAALGPFALAAHSTYLVNPATGDPELRRRSIETLVAEVRRCDSLGVPLLVLHPGSHGGAGEKRGLRRAIAALDRVHRATRPSRVRIAIEITAGQGTSLGWRFEQVAAILTGVADPSRVCVCFDTAHALAAGYDLRTPETYAALWDRFDREIGLEHLAFFHLNDSRTPLGSRVDRHAHIGRGEIKRAPFGWILRDERFRAVPKVIETPKEGDMDRRNLALLRRLAR
jgi:deoxyribonuclease IV